MSKKAGHTGHTGHIICIANQKGGVGKTTTAHALATGLMSKDYKTLAVDSDPQGNLTYTMNAADAPGMYELLKGQIAPHDAIQHTGQGDIIAGSLMLSGADMEFTDTGREYLLTDALKQLQPLYDFIIIDSPPTLGILTINALTAAHDLIIPLGADAYSLQGLSQLNSTIAKVRKHCNPGLNIAGLLITRHSRTVIGRDLKDIIEDKAQLLGAAVYKSVIREGVAIREAQAQQTSIYATAPQSNASADYNSFIDEYIGGLHHA